MSLTFSLFTHTRTKILGLMVSAYGWFCLVVGLSELEVVLMWCAFVDKMLPSFSIHTPPSVRCPSQILYILDIVFNKLGWKISFRHVSFF